MHELLRYGSIIYDANVIVYLCFEFGDRDTTGRAVLVAGPHTAHAKAITRALIENSKSVTTLKRAWDEANRILVSEALEDLIRKGYIQERLQIAGAVSPALKFRIAQALRNGIAALRNRQWFIVNGGFLPTRDRVEAVNAFYARICADPAYHNRIPAYKGNPSETDVHLVLFSGASQVPLLTNDAEIYNVAPELRANGFCEMVKSFKSVRVG